MPKRSEVTICAAAGDGIGETACHVSVSMSSTWTSESAVRELWPPNSSARGFELTDDGDEDLEDTICTVRSDRPAMQLARR